MAKGLIGGSGAEARGAARAQPIGARVPVLRANARTRAHGGGQAAPGDEHLRHHEEGARRLGSVLRTRIWNPDACASILQCVRVAASPVQSVYGRGGDLSVTPQEREAAAGVRGWQAEQ